MVGNAVAALQTNHVGVFAPENEASGGRVARHGKRLAWRVVEVQGGLGGRCPAEGGRHHDFGARKGLYVPDVGRELPGRPVGVGRGNEAELQPAQEGALRDVDRVPFRPDRRRRDPIPQGAAHVGDGVAEGAHGVGPECDPAGRRVVRGAEEKGCGLRDLAGGLDGDAERVAPHELRGAGLYVELERSGAIKFGSGREEALRGVEERGGGREEEDQNAQNRKQRPLCGASSRLKVRDLLKLGLVDLVGEVLNGPVHVRGRGVGPTALCQLQQVDQSVRHRRVALPHRPGHGLFGGALKKAEQAAQGTRDVGRPYPHHDRPDQHDESSPEAGPEPQRRL